MSGTVWAEDAWGAEPFMPAPISPDPTPGVPAAFDPRSGGGLVWLADIEAAQDGGTAPLGGPGWADDAWGAEPPAFAPAGGVETVRVSDLGWRSKASDVGGAVPYPPLLIDGPNIERRVALAPGAQDTFAWGSIRLASPGLVPGTTLTGRDTSMRKLRLRCGLQVWDPLREIMLDPASSQLLDTFTGLALPWTATEDGAEIGLRDPTLWLDAPIGIRRFLGTGGAEGPADLAGKPWPIVRGGTLANPVRACPVVLVDAASRLYRWTDGAVGTRVVAVLEDGVPVYTDDGIVADASSASPAPGHVVSDALGQFKIGSDPAGAVTIDGIGSGDFLAATILRNLLVDTLALPPGLLNEGSVYAAAAVAPYTAGWAWEGTETGREAVQPLLAALGARLVASRSGGLRLLPLRALSGGFPVAKIDASNAVSASPIALEAPLVPPAATWTVGYARTFVTTTTPKPTVSPADRERLAQPWRSAPWNDAANLSRYAQPSRPEMLATALLVQADALSLAAAIGALWGVPRTLWQVTMSTADVLLRDLGDVVTLTWTADGLRGGAVGQIVGDSLRAGDPAASILVLV